MTMTVSYATEPTPGRPNEDFVLCGPCWAGVLDGATARPDVDSGCMHDVAWFAGRLGGVLAGDLARSTAPLPDVLAGAILAVRDDHAATCDLDNPDSPSSTVSLLRVAGDEVEYLVLADSPIVLDTTHGIRAIVDDRLARLPSRTVSAVRRSRNRPHGFWVAGSRPEAAYQAIRGSVPLGVVRRAAVLSDGASRYVERFGLAGWAGLVGLLDLHGPAELIRRVRAAEAAETPEQTAARRGKRHDDATAILVKFTGITG